MLKLYLLVFGINVNGLMTRQSPLDMRYRAEPGNEELYLLVFGINVNGLMMRQSLWICVTGQSLVTRNREF
jgi:hypothetical protein